MRLTKKLIILTITGFAIILVLYKLYINYNERPAVPSNWRNYLENRRLCEDVRTESVMPRMKMMDELRISYCPIGIYPPLDRLHPRPDSINELYMEMESVSILLLAHPEDRLVMFYNSICDAQLGSYLDKVKERIFKYVEKSKTGNPTFRDFLIYLFNNDKKGELRNFSSYFTPIAKLCQPCHTHYDLIEYRESLDISTALSAILQSRHIDMSVDEDALNKLNNTIGTIEFEKHKKRLFSELSYEDRRDLKEVYKLDGRLFGYVIGEG